MADAYERAGCWAELNGVIGPLMQSWAKEGSRGRAENRRLTEQWNRIPEEFRISADDDDEDWGEESAA